MSDGSLEPARRPRRGLVAAVAVLASTAAVLATATFASAAPPDPTATEITVTSAFSPSITVPDTPGVGSSYVVKDVPFDVSFVMDAPLSTTKSTGVVLTVTSGPDAGTLSVPYDVPAGATSGTIAGAVLPTAANNVTLKVAVDAKKTDVAPGTLSVDVLKRSVSAPAGSQLTGFGGGGGAGVPCEATPAEPQCTDLLLPETGGVLSPQLLSEGSCTGVCNGKGSFLFQVLVAVDDDVYNKDNPIEVVAKCDKALCKGGGINSYNVYVELTPGSGAQLSPPCTSKGVVSDGQDFCTDYVQSRRDGAGDLYLYVELPIDAKIIW